MMFWMFIFCPNRSVIAGCTGVTIYTMKPIEQVSRWPIMISQEVKGAWKNQNLPWISVGPNLSY
jgi:hypothetical protein